MSVEPEVETARAALDALPPDWITAEFTTTILRRAALGAAARKFAVMVADAQAELDSTLAAITGGDVADGTLTALFESRAALVELADARQLLPVPTVDSGAEDQVLDVAARALAQRAPVAPVVPDYEDELARWRTFGVNSGRTVDAPVATDADRAAVLVWREAQDKVDQWRASASTWHSSRARSADVLDLLASAQTYLDMAGELVLVVEAANVETSLANSGRRAAGLNWSAAA